MRGEETVHTNLLLEQFGIVAITGGMLRHPHFEVMRLGIGKNLFFFTVTENNATSGKS
jgi:large subunit ribosomal protein L16